MSWKIGWRTEKPSIKELRGVMKFLMKNLMAGTMKVQHGTIITILNYDHYQKMANYEFVHEGHNEGTNEGTIKTRMDKEQYKDSCQYSQVLDLYHKILAELPRVRRLTESRKRMLRARWNEKTKSRNGLRSNTLEFWEAFFKYVSQSDFLMGRNSEWKANFEWIITKRNFL